MSTNMQRVRQAAFVVSLLVLCWLGMMAVHELGHVIGAMVSGGRVERVVLHPLQISRTDVSPNPSPGLVVWSGPILGSVLPLVGTLLVPRRFGMARSLATFFTGFCLIANGAYIGGGAFDRIGDCRVMLRTGSPTSALIAFGAISTLSGSTLWHRLGSIRNFFSNTNTIPGHVTVTLASAALLIATAECAWSALRF